MRLDNATNIPDTTVREVIRFVCPPGVTGYDVVVRNIARGIAKGWAHMDGSLVPTSNHYRTPFVTLHLTAREDAFPYPPGSARGGAYLPRPYFADRVEVLVYLAAHELRHLWQSRVPRGRRVWGARGQYSERDACAYGIRLLRQWRRRDLTGRAIGPIVPLEQSTPRGRRAALPPLR